LTFNNQEIKGRDFDFSILDKLIITF